MSNRLQAAPSLAQFLGWLLPLMIFAGCGGKTAEPEKSEPINQKTKEVAVPEKVASDHTEITPYKFPDQSTRALLEGVASINHHEAHVYQITGLPYSFRLRVRWSSDDLDYVQRIQAPERWEIADRLDEEDNGMILYDKTLRESREELEGEHFLVLLIPFFEDGPLGMIRMKVQSRSAWYTELLKNVLPDEAAGMRERGGVIHPGYGFNSQVVHPGESTVCFFHVRKYEGNGKKRWLTYTLTATGLPDPSTNKE